MKLYKTLGSLLLLGALLLMCALPSLGAIIYVSPSGSDLNDGSTWALAKLTVQAAMNVAHPLMQDGEIITPGDEIWVASGQYAGCITLRPGVGLYGGFSGSETARGQRNWVANVTTLDGGGTGSVITVPGNAPSETVVSGFTICDGSADSGGGILCNSGSAEIINNIITGNASQLGGGVCCLGGSPVIAGNVINGNTASSGGGIYASNCAAEISNNTIVSNTASLPGGGIGGANTTCDLTNNIICLNSSGIDMAGSQPTLECNCVYGNTRGNYSGVSAGQGDIGADPCFADEGAGDYELSANSPCIDAGNNALVEPESLDMDVQARLYGAQVDIGAYEYCPGESADGVLGNTTALVHGMNMQSQDSGPTVVYVNSGAPGPAYDGTSWSSAYLTVQNGINAASSGEQVWVAAGTYSQLITLKEGVAVYGGFVGTETALSQRPAFPRTQPDPDASVLDGMNSSGQYLGGSVVAAPSGLDTSALMDGFTIENGNGTLSGGDRFGGGIYCLNSSPTISNDIVINNSVLNTGGGIYCNGSSPLITNCTVENNTASSSAGGIDCISSASATITGNTISSNTATSGGGMRCYSSAPTISFNTISNNSARSGTGGAIACVSSASPAIMDNTIIGNSASTTGGGVDLSSSSPRISDNIISENTATTYGGGINCLSSSPEIVNNTIADNTGVTGGGIRSQNSSPTITNNIVAYNSSGIVNLGTGTAVSSYNDVYSNTAYNYSGLSAGTGSILANPLFVNHSNIPYDYHLTASSPCIDAGTVSAVDTGDLDIDGQPRINAAGYVDIGADEFYQAAMPTFSPGGGMYNAAQSVIISSTTPGATIYYTMDGSTPTTSSAVYSASVQVSQNLTLNAIAGAQYYATSAVGSANYIIDTVAPTPGTATCSASDSYWTIQVSYTGAEDNVGGSGLNHVELWYMEGASGTWTNSGLTSTGSSDTFNFAFPGGGGTYYFALVAQDNVGNRSAPPSGTC